MKAFLCHLAIGIASAAGQATAEATQHQAPEQRPVQSKPSAKEISDLEARAAGGDASAQIALGAAYEAGNGVPRNDISAAKWYQKAADQGNAVAQNELGVMYRLGQGVNRDKEEAVRWYHKAAKQGNPQALFNLGVSYYNGDGVPSDPMLAYSWFLLAQEAGNPAADDAVKRSAKEGGKLGTPDALAQVGSMYEKGIDLPRSYPEAAKWYRKAADQSPAAALRLALMIIDGRGVPQDFGQAMTLCQGAAKSGYEPAQFCVGFLYQRGYGVPVNPKEAAKWYELAHKRGYGPALMALADMHWRGEGVSVDRLEAYILLVQASQRGVLEAKQKSQTLLKEMSHDDIKHLERKLRDLRYDPKKVFDAMQAGSPGSTEHVGER